MCGIVGFLGQNVEKTLIDKLKKLENRGYDSAGIAVKTKNDIKIFKSKGEIKNLENKVEIQSDAILGIGHTRWATHGKPDELNAHPHCSNSEKWSVVHNGIIENYLYLKEKLIQKGYKFISETDTETVANLLDFYDCGDDLLTVQKVCSAVSGSYAFAIINNLTNTIYFAKNKSPLYISKNENEIMIASDITCFYNFSNCYYQLPDGVMGYAENSKICFYDKFGKVDLKQVEMDLNCYENHNTYKHFMLKEIYETKLAIKNIIEFYSQNDVKNCLDKIDVQKINKIKLIGCGTAYHAALVGAKMIEESLGVECRATVASEFRYSNPIIDENSLIILISQSGETADTLAAFEIAKEKGAKTLAIVNVEYSTLAKLADVYLPIKAGVEVAVASTKAYSAQLTVLYLLSLFLAQKKNKLKFSMDEVVKLYEQIEFNSVNDFKLLADVLRYNDRLFMIGRGNDYFTALEASLKIKETSYVNIDTYYAGELKHGFLALIEQDTYLIAFATDKNVFTKTISNAEEAKARGAKVILFTCFELSETEKENFYYVIKVKDIKSPLQCVINILPWQLIAYYISIGKGINPDKPRNLAKSVTVE